MSTLISSLILATVTAAADLGEWLPKREVMAREAERLASLYTNASARIVHPSENVSIPVETFPDGSVKTVISARRAQIFVKEDIVWGEDVVIRQFSEKGAETARIDAAHFVFDRSTKSGWAEGRAKVVRGQSSFEGTGVYFSSEEEYVTSFGATHILSRDLKVGGAL